MLLETLINPKPKTIVYFIVFSVIFLSLPLFKISGGEYDLTVYYIIFFFSSIIILVLHAFGLNNLIYKNNIIRKENLIIATVFILLNAFDYGVFQNLISSFLMLFFINYLFESYQKEYPFKEIFNASFILSLIVYLNPIMLIMYVLVILCSLIFNYANWRCYVISILGFFTPYLLYILYLSIINNPINPLTFYKVPLLSFSYSEVIDFYNSHQTILFIILSIILISFFEFFNWLYKKSVRSRKAFFILLSYLLISVLIGCFGEGDDWYLVLSPLSVFIANYFTYTKKRNLANILFYVFIFTSCYYRCFVVI
jgi:hypothetical protein